MEGSFDNWQTRQMMQRSGKDFTIVKLLPPGVYQVRFLIWGRGCMHSLCPNTYTAWLTLSCAVQIHRRWGMEIRSITVGNV